MKKIAPLFLIALLASCAQAPTQDDQELPVIPADPISAQDGMAGSDIQADAAEAPAVEATDAVDPSVETASTETQPSSAPEADKGFFWVLGEGVASLGDPARKGLWIKSPFAETGASVDVYVASTGKRVIAEHEKSDDITQMSLDLFKALNVSPSDLVTVEIRTP